MSSSLPCRFYESFADGRPRLPLIHTYAPNLPEVVIFTPRGLRRSWAKLFQRRNQRVSQADDTIWFETGSETQRERAGHFKETGRSARGPDRHQAKSRSSPLGRRAATVALILGHQRPRRFDDIDVVAVFLRAVLFFR